MSKKILSILLALAMVLAIAPVSAFAEDDVLSYLTYEIEYGYVKITDCDTSISGDIVIPAAIEDRMVCKIGDMAFADCNNITSILIPDGVWAIGTDVFLNCNDNIIIRGASDSAAERYANANNIQFEACQHESLMSETVVPTCTWNGYTTYTCTVCGYSYYDNYIDASGHTYDDDGVVTAPTCTWKGYTTYTCTVCGYSYYDNYINASGHTYDDDGVVTAPTCTEQGYTTYTCTICGLTNKDNYVDASGHTDKNTDSVCDVCGMILSGDFGFIVTPSEDNSTITVSMFADFDAFTVAEMYLNFDPEYLEFNEEDNHYYGSNGFFSGAGIPNGYTQEDGKVSIGLMWYYDDAISGMKEFAELEFKVLKKGSSELALNIESWYANSIPAPASITINVHEHDYTEIVTEPTCAEQGYTTYTCSICGYSYVDNYIDASDAYHTYETVVTPAGPEVEGYTTYTCTICGDSFVGEDTPALHSYPEGSLNCDVCGKYALGYEINNGEVTITNCDESISGKVIIPDTIDGYPVTTIRNSAFYYCLQITDVIIPDSVTMIDAFAFEDCISMKSVTISANVTTIGDCAFGYCNQGDLVDGFTIYGVPGSAAETYANENEFKFVAIEESAPELDVKDNADITVTDEVAATAPEMSAETFKNSVENENVQILDKDGKELANDALVGTGSKINILDKDGKVLSTYEVMVKSDVDGNGKITPADARLALRASVGLDTIAGVYETAANYDNKDTVTTSDARMILRKAVGLE